MHLKISSANIAAILSRGRWGNRVDALLWKKVLTVGADELEPHDGYILKVILAFNDFGLLFWPVAPFTNMD